MQNATPMLRQYLDIKKLYPGTILFFRLGDFYEMFNEDAILASRELEITLTARRREPPTCCQHGVCPRHHPRLLCECGLHGRRPRRCALAPATPNSRKPSTVPSRQRSSRPRRNVRRMTPEQIQHVDGAPRTAPSSKESPTAAPKHTPISGRLDGRTTSHRIGCQYGGAGHHNEIRPSPS